MREPLLGLALTGILFLLAACGGSDAPVLRVGGIPDQDASRLVRRYGGFAEYLFRNLGVEVEYIPIVDQCEINDNPYSTITGPGCSGNSPAGTRRRVPF